MSAELISHDTEMVSVLFVDIVGHTLQSIEGQNARLTLLQRIVGESANSVLARSPDKLISIPTGDGMALVFFRNPILPALCALEIARSLRRHPEVTVRMGLNHGPVIRHLDIKAQVNVVGSGINTAQRIMDCGDAGHILVSHNVAEVLDQFAEWRECIKDLGVHEVKNSARVHLYNFCKEDLGNPETPRKIKVTVELPPQASAAPAKPAGPSHWRWLWTAGLAVVLAAVGLIVEHNRSVTSPLTITPPASTISSAPTTETVSIADASPLHIALDDDVPSDAAAGQPLNFAVVDDFKAGDNVVIAKGAKVVGSVIRAKKMLGIRGKKLSFRLTEADALDGQKLSVRATASRASKGPDSRSFDTANGPKSKNVAADKGSEYTGYIDGTQMVTIRK
jgi:class 3 adenylate cyclase